MRIWMKLTVLLLLVTACHGCSRETETIANSVVNKSLPDGWKKSVALPQIVDERGNMLIWLMFVESRMRVARNGNAFSPVPTRKRISNFSRKTKSRFQSLTVKG
jgi:hypothetical protein